MVAENTGQPIVTAVVSQATKHGPLPHGSSFPPFPSARKSGDMRLATMIFSGAGRCLWESDVKDFLTTRNGRVTGVAYQKRARNSRRLL